MESLLAPTPITEGGNLPEQWKRFKTDFELFLQATGKNDEAGLMKVAILRRTIGPRGSLIFESFKWDEDGDQVKYDKVIEKFEAFCKVRVSTYAQTHKLLTMKQGPLSIDEYITSLHTVARDCDLKVQYDRFVLQALLLGIESDTVRRQVFERGDFTLDEALEKCRAHEATGRDLREIKSNTVEQANSLPTYRSKPGKQQKQREDGSTCGRCGSKPSHPLSECKANGAVCHKCNGKNHFAACCRSRNYNKAQQAHSTKEKWNYSSDSESANAIQVRKTDRKLLATVSLKCGETTTNVEFQLDTAATCNILCKKDYNALGSPKMKRTKTKLTVYDGSTVAPKGWCNALLMQKKVPRELKFLVVDTDQRSLLSLATCLDLNLITANEQAMLVGAGGGEFENTLQEYNHVFHGIGKLPGEYDMQLDPKIQPIQVRPRKVPVSMKNDLETKLTKLIEDGMIEKVNSPTEWISHMQPVRKPNGQIRVCLDPQHLNTALKRNHYPMPCLDDVLLNLKGAKYFTLCDAKDGFLQVALTARSSDLTTFWTPFGRYRWKRMPFGISTAPEEFQERLSRALEGLENVAVVADDILIYGENRATHDRCVRGLLQRASECGLKLNKAKCRFAMTELPYIGHLVTDKGVRPDPEKVKGIHQMQPPKDADETRVFLGHVNYMSKFIPNMSTISEPLRKLMSKTSDFEWESEQQASFEALKTALSEDCLLQYFDANKPVTLQTDASRLGLGAALMQDGRPIAYASRSLSKSEQNYAAIELECLAVLFGLQKYDQYVFGHSDVQVHTDHKPLETIIKKSILSAPKRIQSMLLSMQRYQFKVFWKPGSSQVTADWLSRHTAHCEKQDEPATREQVFQAQLHLKTAESMERESPSRDGPVADEGMNRDIRQATKVDQTMQLLEEYIRKGWPSFRSRVNPEVQCWWPLKDTLTAQDGCIYKGTRVVIPTDLRREILTKLHCSHQGAQSTLRRARLTVYWPGLKKDVEAITASCSACLQDSSKNQRETLRHHEVPEKPWTKVALDLFQHEQAQYLVCTDYTSGYFDFERLQDTLAATVVECCKRNFARLGVPALVHSDNGPQFTSSQFANFTKEWGFNHSTSSPHHSQSNGKVESSVKLAKRMLRRASDPWLALLEYRNTPTEGMKSTPIERLTGKHTRSVLPQRASHGTESDGEDRSRRQRAIQSNYDKGAKDLPLLKTGTPVLVQDFTSRKNKWKEGKVIDQLSSRSYTVEIGGEFLRRNRKHLVRDPTSQQQETADPTSQQQETAEVQESTLNAASNQPNEQSVQLPRTTRAGREVKTPTWAKDYVT